MFQTLVEIRKGVLKKKATLKTPRRKAFSIGVVPQIPQIKSFLAMTVKALTWAKISHDSFQESKQRSDVWQLLSGIGFAESHVPAWRFHLTLLCIT
jgi:hypothetical protein